MGIRTWLGAALLAVAGIAQAGGAGAVRKQIEASLLVRGTIDLDASGQVVGVDYKYRDKLPVGVIALVDQAAKHWRFEPIDLGPDARVGRAQMTVRVVAKKAENGDYQIWLKGAQFGKDVTPEPVRRKWTATSTVVPPKYPAQALRAGVQGTVYVLARIGPDGRVQDAIAQQINLRYVDSENVMNRARSLLGNASVDAAKASTFSLPADFKPTDPHWVVRIPYEYMIDTVPTHETQWVGYVPGPTLPNPWSSDTEDLANADAQGAGDMLPEALRMRLLTALNPPAAGG